MIEMLMPRMQKKIKVTPSDCWEWTAATNRGYGIIQVNGKARKAHRVAWETIRGPIPTGLVIDHQCRNTLCVNPDHLRVVTSRVNTVENSRSVQALNAAKTHCVKGHPFTDENTYLFTEGRSCMECRRTTSREWYRNNLSKSARLIKSLGVVG